MKGIGVGGGVETDFFGFKDNEFRAFGMDNSGNSIGRSYAHAEGFVGGSYEQETKYSASGKPETTTTFGFSTGAIGTLSNKFEYNSATKEFKAISGLSIGFDIGLGFNLRAEFFLPLITQTSKPNK